MEIDHPEPTTINNNNNEELKVEEITLEEDDEGKIALLPKVKSDSAPDAFTEESSSAVHQPTSPSEEEGSNAADNDDDEETADPRMIKALEAKLKRPQLTFAAALRIGGYRYPARANSAAKDDENVTLSDRKNQLNRRIRKLRVSQYSQFMDKQRADEQQQQQQQKEQEDQLESLPECPTEGLCIVDEAMASPTDSTAAPNAMAPAHDNRNNMNAPPIPAPAPVTTADSILGNNNGMAENNNSNNSLWNHHRRVVSASDQSSRSSNSSPSWSTASNSSNITGRSNGMAPPDGPPANDGGLSDHRMNRAVHNFGQNVTGLYQQAMLQAGFSLEDTQESSETYRTFALKCGQQECSRLQDMLSTAGADDRNIAPSQQPPIYNGDNYCNNSNPFQ